jgi:hypothetical protein
MRKTTLLSSSPLSYSLPFFFSSLPSFLPPYPFPLNLTLIITHDPNPNPKVCADLLAEMPGMKGKSPDVKGNRGRPAQITFYHAEVKPDEKEERQRAWSRGEITVIW